MGVSEWEREKKERERGGGNEGIIETDKEIESIIKPKRRPLN